MVPGSLARRPGDRLLPAKATWRPPNLRWGARSEMRALVLWSAVLGTLTIVSLLGYVWVRIQVVEAGYRLSVTRQLVERLERERRELEVRAAAADAPWRLQELASARLGMRRPYGDEEGPLP
jgi:cell division protein FtsL